MTPSAPTAMNGSVSASSPQSTVRSSPIGLLELVHAVHGATRLLDPADMVEYLARKRSTTGTPISMPQRPGIE